MRVRSLTEKCGADLSPERPKAKLNVTATTRPETESTYVAFQDAFCHGRSEFLLLNFGCACLSQPQGDAQKGHTVFFFPFFFRFVFCFLGEDKKKWMESSAKGSWWVPEKLTRFYVA